MEQLVAHWAHNPKAIGSNPILATKKQLIKKMAQFKNTYSNSFNTNTTSYYLDVPMEDGEK